MSDHPIAHYLRQYNDFAIFSGTAAPEDWAHRTYHGMVLELGQPFERKRLPRSFRRMSPQLCFSNAMRCVMRDGTDQYRYVEGHAGPLAFDHAWVLDTEDGKVFDPTWSFEPNHMDYWGIVFPTEWAWATMRDRNVWGLLGNDWQHDNGLLRLGAAAWTESEEAA